MNTTKITKLTSHNVAALAAHADELKVTTGKTFAEFEGTPAAALTRVRKVQEEVAAKHGGRHSTAASLHAVARKLEAATKEQPTVPTDEQREAALAEATEAPKLALVIDSTEATHKEAPAITKVPAPKPVWGTAKQHGLKGGSRSWSSVRTARPRPPRAS
jgi:hypothetical protein